MNLYEIDQELMNCVDFETGELVNEERWNELQQSRDTKIEGLALWIKNLVASAKAFKEEKDAFASRQKAAENKAERLKQFLSDNLGGSKFETPKVKVSFRKSKTINIAEGAKIPDEYLKVKAPDIDKSGLKEAIKNGAVIDGVELVEKQNIQIK